MPLKMLFRKTFPARDYDLGLTFTSGQAFRWDQTARGWEGVVAGRWVCLTQDETTITCETASPAGDWLWVVDYLQLGVEMKRITGTFPIDGPMLSALRSCRGLRLLKQDPWEVLASYILSSTKQIVQIRQVVATLCRSYGLLLPVPPGHPPAHSFPGPKAITRCSEAELRACKMGFRAPYLKAAAQAVDAGRLDLGALGRLPVKQARERLMALPGVGPKVANCVLLSAYNFPTAFPLDVWVLRALRELYFQGKRPILKRLLRFSEAHFGPWSGYAQLYLFHYKRVILKNRKNHL